MPPRLGEITGSLTHLCPNRDQSATMHVDNRNTNLDESPMLEAWVVICAHTLDRWSELNAAVMSVRCQTRAPREIQIGPRLGEGVASISCLR